MQPKDRLQYVLQLADNALIHGQRLSEWCGYGPVLEQDIALTNVALDHIGQARMYFQYASDLEGLGNNEDHFAMKRDAWDFRNVLLLELPKGHWGDTIARCFFFDTFNFYLTEALRGSQDPRIAEVAEKAIKEIAYHAQFSAEWIIRLGDGTSESHQKIQQSIDDIWEYTGGLFEKSTADIAAQEANVGPDLDKIKEAWQQKVDEILDLATLKKPEGTWMQRSGKDGQHTEHIGFILAEMQFLPRAYPDATW
ncbi:MAG: phenylacetate-CoA oxygenase subunit PaaC [Schleiferiaceae bacterium]|nr:phenylacetate-CoA oxygenase subunit PaaC [Schleiferiaceae bacterium]